jgi:hypothetical protein
MTTNFSFLIAFPRLAKKVTRSSRRLGGACLQISNTTPSSLYISKRRVNDIFGQWNEATKARMNEWYPSLIPGRQAQVQIR